MFDFSFSELMVVGAVALVVIGPERLPKVARTVGHLLGRAQRYVSDVKGDIRRELELDELRKMRTEMETAARNFETKVTTEANEMRSSVEETGRSIESSFRDTDASASGDAQLDPPVGGSTDIAASDTVLPADPPPSYVTPPPAVTPVAGRPLALPPRASVADVMARALRDRTAIGPDRLSS